MRMHENSEHSGTTPSTPASPTAPVPADRILLGLNTFGDVDVRCRRRTPAHAQVLRQLLEQAEVADAVGLHCLRRRGAPPQGLRRLRAGGVPGRHRRGHGQTSGSESAVTVLSSDDPIRVFQRFATVDAVSNGRAEVMLGRGSFIESFPLFGLDLADYEVLFEEKLELFDKVRSQNPVNWEGRTRAGLRGLMRLPAVEDQLLPTWIGVGGSPSPWSACAQYGYPMIFAIIGGAAAALPPAGRPLPARRWPKYGQPTAALAMHSPGYVAATDEEAREEFFPHWLELRNKLGAERGWGPAGRGEFEAAAARRKAPCTSVRRKPWPRRSPGSRADLGVDRFDLKYSSGTLPHGR